MATTKKNQVRKQIKHLNKLAQTLDFLKIGGYKLKKTGKYHELTSIPDNCITATAIEAVARAGFRFICASTTIVKKGDDYLTVPYCQYEYEGVA